jgi:hypothetical protein
MANTRTSLKGDVRVRLKCSPLTRKPVRERPDDSIERRSELWLAHEYVSADIAVGLLAAVCPNSCVPAAIRAANDSNILAVI